MFESNRLKLTSRLNLETQVNANSSRIVYLSIKCDLEEMGERRNDAMSDTNFYRFSLQECVIRISSLFIDIANLIDFGYT